MSNRLRFDTVANFESLLRRIRISIRVSACDRSRTINSRLVVGATKGCQEVGEPCPCKTGREFSSVRTSMLHARVAHTRDYLPRAELGAEACASRQLSGCFVGRQSRWAGSGIPRRARVSGTHRRASLAARKLGKSSLEAVRRDSQGRCCSSKKIFLLSRVSFW